MAQVLNGNQVKLNSGQVVQAQTGGWYDGQQFVNGSLSNPGQIHPESNQQGAGQAVSAEVIAQTNPANVAYVNQQRQQQNLAPVPQQTPAGPPTGTPTTDASTAGGTVGYTPPASINLPQLYEQLYASSGVRDTEALLTQKTNDYNAQVAKIKDNPYLAEGTMTGRLAKLDAKFNADTANIKNDIAMKKADIETKLNLQTKQFDINSQQAQQEFQKFQTLLSSGSLDNATGEDIANLTRATGLSSSMIQSAISANKKKNNPVSITQVDDGKNIYAVAVDASGNVVNRQILGDSKPTKSSGSGGGTSLSATQQRSVVAAAAKSLTSVDNNKDKLISLEEYKKAVQLIISSTGVDLNTADDILTQQFNTLGYKKWKW